MSRGRLYLTTAIPYVNGEPHLGHALELVHADVLARHRRRRGDAVRLLTGSDEHALKNVTAAAAAGVPVARFVASGAARFRALAAALDVAADDFIRTGADPRHRPGVERLWRACAAAGDLYQRDYEGLYCGGCEAFLAPGELSGGCCPEHGRPPERVAERNWFFRLSRYEAALRERIERGSLRVVPATRRNEVLAQLRAGLDDLSVSRPAERARGWGIPVPGDPRQVVYVWFDALANYVSALGYGGEGAAYDEWWLEADERLHVIGKGIVRFHALAWPAVLLSAREPLPTAIAVHGYVTVDGRKLSKSLGGGADPFSLVERFGADALRWWLLREVPRGGDADFRRERVAASADELADGVGNLVNRTIALLRRRPAAASSTPTVPAEGAALARRCAGLAAQVDEALAAYDLRAGAGAVWGLAEEANRLISAARPWELGRAARAGDARAAARLHGLLTLLEDACRRLAGELEPFLPAAAGRIEAALEDLDPARGRTLLAKAEG